MAVSTDADIRELIENAEPPTCEFLRQHKTCGREARWTMRQDCGHHGGLACDNCRANFIMTLRITLRIGHTWQCIICNAFIKEVTWIPL